MAFSALPFSSFHPVTDPPTQNPDGTFTYPDGTRTPPGYVPDPATPPGYIPHFDAKGVLAGYKDPNGVLVGQIAGAVKNPDGSITYPNGNGQFFTTRPGGTSSVTGGGLTTNFDTGGNRTPTTNADGTPATPGQVSDQSNRSNGPLGAGGLLGLGSNPVAGAFDAARAGGIELTHTASQDWKDATSSGGGGGAGGGAGGAGAGSISVDPIYAAAAASKAMQDQFLAAYNAAHPNQPPTMSAAQLPPAVQAEMMAKIQASQADQLGPISASHATASLLDPTMQAEQRGRALGLEDQYGDVIAGKAPSVAYLQLMEALQKNESNQLGLASRASGGGNVALALRTSANNIGRLNQGASADAAMLRAKEIADARTGLGGLIDQTRTGDINFAGHNADLSTDVSKTNANNDTSATLKAAELEAARRASNATLTTGAATEDARLEAARRAANATATNTTNLKQGELNTTAASNNLTAAISQQQIDAAAKDAAAKNAIASGGQVITGTVGAADAQARAVAAAQAAKDAQDKKDAAWLGAISTVGAAALA